MVQWAFFWPRTSFSEETVGLLLDEWVCMAMMVQMKDNRRWIPEISQDFRVQRFPSSIRGSPGVTTCIMHHASGTLWPSGKRQNKNSYYVMSHMTPLSHCHFRNTPKILDQKSWRKTPIAVWSLISLRNICVTFECQTFLAHLLEQGPFWDFTMFWG